MRNIELQLMKIEYQNIQELNNFLKINNNKKLLLNHNIIFLFSI